eukprot:m.347207 g.347207  ORF g.347207 m.347207 type:complete len:113 (+) comp55850_c0_seq2:926-1264(+)
MSVSDLELDDMYRQGLVSRLLSLIVVENVGHCESSVALLINFVKSHAQARREILASNTLFRSIHRFAITNRQTFRAKICRLVQVLLDYASHLIAQVSVATLAVFDPCAPNCP